MKTLTTVLKKYRKETISAPLLKMAEASLELLTPLFIKKLVDAISGNASSGLFWQYGILFLLFALFGLAFSVTAQYFSSKAAVYGVRDLREKTYRKIQMLTFSQRDAIGTSTLLTRLTDDMSILENSINLTLRLFLRSPFIVFGAMTMAFILNWKCGLLFLGIIALLFAVAFLLLRILIQKYRKVQEGIDRITKKTGDYLKGFRTIRGLNLRNKEEIEFLSQNKTLLKFQNAAGFAGTFLNPVTFVILNAGMILLLMTGDSEETAGLMTQGTLVALIDYLGQILTELLKFANLVMEITKGLSSLHRINEILELPEEEKIVWDFPSAPDLAIEISDLTFSYGKNARPVLSNLNFQLKKNEKAAFIGGTGAGKTSLINLIMGFYQPDSGSVRVSSEPVVVLQKGAVFSGTIRDNLKIGNPSATDEEMLRAMRIARGDDLFKGKGLDEPILENGANLSGGQKQRLLLARGLVSKAEILILDDGLSALDYDTAKEVIASLKSELPEKTMIFISQRVQDVKEFDTIYCMEHGRIIDFGNDETLRKKSVYYKEYAEAQE